MRHNVAPPFRCSHFAFEFRSLNTHTDLKRSSLPHQSFNQSEAYKEFFPDHRQTISYKAVACGCDVSVRLRPRRVPYLSPFVSRFMQAERAHSTLIISIRNRTDAAEQCAGKTADEHRGKQPSSLRRRRRLAIVQENDGRTLQPAS